MIHGTTHPSPAGVTESKETHKDGVKFDTGKQRLDLVPVEMLDGLADPLTYGVNKYEANNWRKGLAYSRVMGAALRHLASFRRGVLIDEESGLNHIDQAFINLGMLVTFEREGRSKELNDLYKQPEAK